MLAALLPYQTPDAVRRTVLASTFAVFARGRICLFSGKVFQQHTGQRLFCCLLGHAAKLICLVLGVYGGSAGVLLRCGGLRLWRGMSGRLRPVLYCIARVVLLLPVLCGGWLRLAVVTARPALGDSLRFLLAMSRLMQRVRCVVSVYVTRLCFKQGWWDTQNH